MFDCLAIYLHDMFLCVYCAYACMVEMIASIICMFTPPPPLAPTSLGEKKKGMGGGGGGGGGGGCMGKETDSCWWLSGKEDEEWRAQELDDLRH